MTSLRLLADDLTGALDTAAAFVPLTGPVGGFWRHHDQLPANAAIDAATRELDRATAMSRHHALSDVLAQADIAFKKIDSLLRGHTFPEIAACFATGHWDRIVLAPAFPFQGRVTRDSCQYRRSDDGRWQNVGDIRAGLAAEGLASGVSVFDAETDSNLQSIVRRNLAAGGRILWCGSAGLAQALVAVLAPSGLATPDRVRAPVLGLFGSDQDVTARQLANCAPYTLHLSRHYERSEATQESDGGFPGLLRSARNDEENITKYMAQFDVAMIGFDLPPDTPRAAAAGMIRDRIATLLPALPKPGTLVVAGGETLRTVCDLLGTTHLEVTGAELPGVPRSVMRGGAWDGVDVISKSGAFGAPNLLRDLLASADIAFERIG